MCWAEREYGGVLQGIGFGQKLGGNSDFRFFWAEWLVSGHGHVLRL